MNLVSTPISQLATVQSGAGAPQDARAFTRTGFPFVRAGSLSKLLDGAEESSLELIEPEVADEYGLKLFPAGTVLFAKSGMSATKGHVYRLKSPAYVVNHLAALVPHKPSDSAFLAHALQHYSPTVLIKDSAYPSIRLGDIENMRIQAPSSPRERERIAEILDKADALRAKRRAALAQLDTLTQSIFLDMFGDPVTNPQGWNRVRFEDICDRVTVGIVVKPASYYVPEGVPALRSLNIKPRRITLEDLVFFSYSDNETKLAKTRLKAGDLVLVRSGQPGTAAVVPSELDGVNAIDLLISTPQPESADVVFLCEFFNSKGGRDLVLSSQRGQVQKHLNVGSLRQAQIPLPPIDLQREFARRVAVVEKLKAAKRAALAELDALFVSLQHRVFRGELAREKVAALSE